ncbi:MAG: response regulator, partial [Halomonas sp.]|nr:response regulator [Halomonas sp.]
MTQTLYPAFGVLLVDDEPSFLRSLSIALERSGGINHIHRCHDSREVMEILARENIGLVTLDLTMPHPSGEELLARIVEEYPDVGVIVISGLNQVETAVNCIKLGAFDYFVKTDEESRLIEGIRRAIRLQELSRENQALRRRVLCDTLEHPEVFANIVTADKAMRSVFQYLESVALTRQPILITGESGVGKELIARAAHTLSGRSGPLVCVNVAGLDDNVFADTLFGHQRGAF